MSSLLDKLKMLGYKNIGTSSGVDISHKNDTIKLIRGENEINLIHPLTKTSTSETNIFEYKDITLVEEQLKYRNTTRAVVLLPDGKIFDSEDKEKLQKMIMELPLKHDADGLFEHFRFVDLWNKEEHGIKISDKVCLFGNYLVDFHTPQIRKITTVLTCAGYIVMKLSRMNSIDESQFIIYDCCGWIYNGIDRTEDYNVTGNKIILAGKFKLHDCHCRGEQVRNFKEELTEILDFLDFDWVEYSKFLTSITNLT